MFQHVIQLISLQLSESGFSHLKIYNLNLTLHTPVSRSLPSPLSCSPPLSPAISLPRFPTFLKLILKNGLVGLSKSWIRSPLFYMSVLCAPWNISLKVRQRYIHIPDVARIPLEIFSPLSPSEIKAGRIKKILWVGFIRHAQGPPQIFLNEKECFYWSSKYEALYFIQ